jgi:hypothetical protein
MTTYPASYCFNLCLGALEGEATEPDRNSLGLITIEVNKVLSAAVELTVVTRPVLVRESALRGVGELGELGRSADKAVLAVDCGVAKELVEAAGLVVDGDSGRRISAAHIVKDGERDFGRGSASGSRTDAGGEGKDGGCDGNGELHFDG